MEKVKIAMIGGGRIGASHIQAMLKLKDSIEVGGIIDLNTQVADKMAKEYNIPAFYSVEDALKDKSIDAFIIGLPHFLHFPVGKQILEAKRHVLMEKPLGITLEEVEKLIQIANENAVVLMSGQSRRYYTAIQEAKRLLTEIDGPTNMLYNFAPIFTKESAPPWWQEEKKTGGLVLGMLGSHTIDLTLWMFEGKKPIRLYCETRSISEVFEGDDAASIIIKFDDGTMATNYMSISNNPIKHECLIEGRKGSIFFSHHGDHEGTVGAASTKLYVNGSQRDTSDEPDCFTVQIKEFADSILEKRPPLTSAENVYSTYLLIEAAKESAKRQAPIDIPAFLESRKTSPV